jgi:hypothetical protein
MHAATENLVGALAVLLMGTIALGMVLWMAGAIYFDVGCGARWSWLPAVAWCLLMAVLFAVWRPLWCPYAALLAAALVFLGWWLSLKPSHDRPWDASVAVLPRAVRRGDVVTIENVRNNAYRSYEDFKIRYETRSYHLVNSKAAVRRTPASQLHQRHRRKGARGGVRRLSSQ